MWLGASSRVALPDAKTDESLSNVYLLSGFGYCFAAPSISIFSSASGCWCQRPPGKAPLVMVIALASAPPTKNPRENGWRMLRER